MVVTQIIPLTNSRSKIYIDNEFAFVLYKGELRNYKIAEGKEIDSKLTEEIIENILNKRAKLRGMSLLKSRPYTERQMHDKLKQGFYPEQVIETALEYFKSYGYIDDLHYATDYIEYYSETKSCKRLEQDLLNKGIDKSVLKEAFFSWMDEGGRIDEEFQIRELLKKKSYSPENCDNKEKQKLMAYLFRKGFDISNIKRVLECY